MGVGRYHVSIVHAQTTKVEAKEGKEGYLCLTVGFGCADGQIGETLRFSTNAKKYSRDKLIAITGEPELLRNVEFWRAPYKFMGKKECEIVTEMDDFDPEKPRLKVKYINSLFGGIPANDKDAESLASMFAGSDDTPF